MYEGFEIQEAIPEASSMIETFRAIGYNLETAVADIIDNSITACAKQIIIQRYWDGGNSIISIKDDGMGMTNEDLIHAMRPGAQNPLVERDEKDLGRFGLGLKTASFSQCRKLTVLSKKNGITSFWTWDLDFVAKCKKWNLIHWCPEAFKNSLDDVESGTIVIWSELDRIIPLNVDKMDQVAKERFSMALQKVREHIAMTFHRFILEKNINSIRQTVDDAFIAKYADLSYPELTTLWQEVGLGSYCDGMLKIINPSDYQDVLNSCYIMDYDKSFLPFMCTAFGDVFAYVKNSRLKNYIVYLNVRYGTYLILPDNLVLLLGKIIFNKSILKGWFDLENYPVIQEVIGTPGYDECFGYSPLLALGGSESIENVRIVKTLPYIDISTQTIGRFKDSDKF